MIRLLHGTGCGGKTVMGNKRLVNSLLARGHAVLVRTAQRRFRGGSGFVWNFFPGWERRDENRFLQHVAADVSGRFGLARGRFLLVAGFCAETSLVSRRPHGS